MSSTVNHLLTMFQLRLVHNFEHHLKVYMEELYQGMDFEEKDRISDLFKHASVNKYIGSVGASGMFENQHWNNCKIPFHRCSEENGKKVVDATNNFNNPKGYYVLDAALLSEIANLYIRSFPQSGEKVLCCNKQRNGGYFLKGDNAFLTRLTYRRNDVSHQNLLFNYLKPSEQLCISSRQFVSWIEPSKYDQIMKKSELFTLLTKNVYNFDLFYLLMTKDSLLSRHSSVNNRRKNFHAYTIHSLKEIVEVAKSYHYCNEWVVETIDFYQKCIEITSLLTCDTQPYNLGAIHFSNYAKNTL